MNAERTKFRWRQVLLTLVGSLAIPLVWWSLKRFTRVPDLYLPSPGAVVGAARDLEPGLVVHTCATVGRLLIGFIGGTMAGVATGIALSRWPALDALCSPMVHSLRAVPAAATVPFFLLWFGFSEIGRYLIVFLAVGLNVAVASSQILARHTRAHSAFFASFEFSPGAFPLRYSLPKIAEELLPTLRFSLATACGAVAVAELLGSQVGLGYLLQTGRSTFAFHLMFLAIILIGIVASALDWIVRVLWRRLLYWKQP